MTTSVLICFKVCLQEIGEEEDFKDKEHDKKLDQNDQPHLFAPSGKARKALDIKLGDLF